MQFAVNESCLMTPNLNHSFALRRNVRIKSSKLPPDFFNNLSRQRYGLSPRLDRYIGTDISNRDIKTPSFECNRAVSRSREMNGQKERKVETARVSLAKIENQDDLISGIISTSRKLRKVFRKQSLQFKQSYSVHTEDKLLRLPKILGKEHSKHF